MRTTGQKFAEVLDRRGKLRQIPIPDHGSAFRSGDKIAAIAFPAGVSVADGASSSLVECAVEEAGVIDRLVIGGAPAGVALRDLSVNGIPMITGYVPASIFDPASRCNPPALVFVDQTTKIRARTANESGAAVFPDLAFGVAPGGAPQRAPRLLAIGGPTETVIQEATSEEIVVTIERPGLLGRLVVEAWGTAIDEDQIRVESVKYDGDELVSGSVPGGMFTAHNECNPILGVYVEPGHRLTVEVHNKHAANDASVILGFTCI